MRRLLAGFVVIAVMAVVGVALLTRSSSAASPRLARSGVAATVVVTPRLRRLLRGEIVRLRAAQPILPARPLRPLNHVYRAPLAPERGVPCFVAGSARCSEIPCQEFASAPAVYETPSIEIRVPGARRRAMVPVVPGPVPGRAHTCTRRAPRKLVLVSAP